MHVRIKSGGEPAPRFSAIVHQQILILPPPIKVEEASPLPDIDDFVLEQAKRYQAVLGGAPAVIDGSRQAQVLGAGLGSTDPGRALHSAGGAEAIQTQMRRIRRGHEVQEKSVGSAAGYQFSGSRPVEQKSPSPTDMKRPGAGDGGHQIHNDEAKDCEPENLGKKSAPLWHGASIAPHLACPGRAGNHVVCALIGGNGYRVGLLSCLQSK
jgi:hypothetical protein